MYTHIVKSDVGTVFLSNVIKSNHCFPPVVYPHFDKLSYIYEYYTTLNGEKENQLRANTQSDGAIYWYDAKRNELCSFNGNLNSVSKLRGVQSYLNNNSESILKDPIAAYDKKYNEALFTLVDNTLVFNERIDAFTSFYSYSPDYYAEFSDKLYTFKNLKLFKYNSGDSTNLYDDKAKKAYISFVVNQNYPLLIG